MSAGLRTFLSGRNWRGRPYLISPFFDFLCSGGLAIIVIFLLILLFPPNAPAFAQEKLALAACMAFLAYLVNDPHFMASYQILYRDYLAKLRRFRTHPELFLRYLAAGVVVPAVMAVYFLYAIAVQDKALFGHAFFAMLIIVGWHYAKQAFGIFIMLSAMKKVFYPRWQRRFFLINSYVVWGTYCIAVLSYDTNYQDYMDTIGGIDYIPRNYFTLSEDMLNYIGGVFVFFGLASLLLAVWDRKNPAYSKTGLIAYLSMYYLLLAAALHPMLILVYPFFHSLQYLLFIYAYRRGEAASQVGNAGGVAVRTVMHQILQSLLFAIGLGVLFFFAIPAFFEGIFNPDNALLLPLTGVFIIFINIHHYFIDNVIWRKENPEVSAYLFFENGEKT